MARKKEKSFVEWIGQNIYIRPHYVVSIPDFFVPYKTHSLKFEANKVNLKDNSHGGNISQKADKKCRSAINWLLCASEKKQVFHSGTGRWFNFKVNFITLTLPDTVSSIREHEFKTKLLNPWLTVMRKYYGLKNYVWKIEFQKNGKLHLHITSDTFIHYAILKKTWNKLLRTNGYIFDYQKKFMNCSFEEYKNLMSINDKRSDEAKYKAWLKGTAENWLNPNTTDVHSVKKIKNLAGYIAKYMTKNEADKKKIRGRIWGCNYELSRANKTKIFIDRTACAKELKCLMQPHIAYHRIETPNSLGSIPKLIGEVYKLRYSDWIKNITGSIKAKFDETILGLKNLAHDGTLFNDLLTV